MTVCELNLSWSDSQKGYTKVGNTETPRADNHCTDYPCLPATKTVSDLSQSWRSSASAWRCSKYSCSERWKLLCPRYLTNRNAIKMSAPKNTITNKYTPKCQHVFCVPGSQLPSSSSVHFHYDVHHLRSDS